MHVCYQQLKILTNEQLLSFLTIPAAAVLPLLPLPHCRRHCPRAFTVPKQGSLCCHRHRAPAAVDADCCLCCCCCRLCPTAADIAVALAPLLNCFRHRHCATAVIAADCCRCHCRFRRRPTIATTAVALAPLPPSPNETRFAAVTSAAAQLYNTVSTPLLSPL